MKSFFPAYILPFVLIFNHCDFNTKSEVDLEFGAIQGLLNGNSQIIYLGEIDMENTSNCGVANPDNTTGQQPGQGGGVGGTNSVRNTQNGQQNTRYSIISTFNMKDTFETLNMRFTYDRRQIQGPINPQQGFVFTGGFFGNTVTGRQGTVKWGQNGINLIAGQANQELNFMRVELDLNGTFVPGGGSVVPPNTCNTQDGVNCTAATTNTQCFTQDNRTCIGDTAAAEGAVQTRIRGTITCVAPQVI